MSGLPDMYPEGEHLGEVPPVSGGHCFTSPMRFPMPPGCSVCGSSGKTIDSVWSSPAGYYMQRMCRPCDAKARLACPVVPTPRLTGHWSVEGVILTREHVLACAEALGTPSRPYATRIRNALEAVDAEALSDKRFDRAMKILRRAGIVDYIGARWEIISEWGGRHD